MDAPVAVKFNSHAEFGAHFRACLARSQGVLEMFDPDFSVFPLGQSDVDAALRHFLAAGGALVLAMHRTDHIERECPRFLRLLRDYSHRVECRATPPNLHQLTDSFCIGDQIHIVRRFHCDHMRGEAAFDNPAACEISLERFAAIWLESRPCLHPTVTGL
ncbi:hypothetical protein Q4S45_14030 [Massilia sp. R2A-15]|uniref:DUF7931 domain-containing protein n=1 Tax=Massilia sp. R2A-15 TaxID=3064278 RepID=UPI00273469AD|nr:hypothetical protein [Massilia sp. R2A-15]WLI87856.1 hypothetical protein Q4S45_14030 [Massilia sp. R2A-15]